MKKAIFSMAFLLVSIGCKNPFTDFYQDRTGGLDLVATGAIAKPTGDPVIYGGDDPEGDYLRMREDGYGLLGFSSFNSGGNVDKDAAIAQGRKVGASIIRLYPPKHTGTRSGAMPMMMPNNTTTYSSGSATAYGPGGTMNVYGTGTSTTYGTQVVVVPYRVSRYDYMATYWAKDIRPIIFGVEFQELTPEERSQIGSNKGARVHVVMKGSPAFRADIMRGDIIKKIGETEIIDVDQARKTTRQYEGKTVSVELIRAGNPKTIQVEMNRPQGSNQ